MSDGFSRKLFLVVILAGLVSVVQAKKFEQTYTDTNIAQLGEDELVALEGMEGQWMRPQYGISDPNYNPDWSVITSHDVPEWLLDAKFGMYTHWGIYSVPAFQGNTYVRHMYTPSDSRGNRDQRNEEHYEHHKATYGDPTEFGYTDFIPMFKCEDFEGADYVELMKATGAKFGGLCVVHHDGFLMWDSDVSRWNVGEMGPERDIYGEFVEAAREADFKTCATFHHARSWNFALRGFDPEFYSEEEQRKLDIMDPEKSDFFLGQPGGKLSRDEFAKQWRKKVLEVIDKYHPDLLWFDGINRTQPQSPERYVVDFLQYYYDQAQKRGQRVVVCNKLPAGGKDNIAAFNFPEGTGIRCYEGGRNMPPDAGEYWLTDRAISYPWSYVKNKNYNLGADVHVRALADQTARGGIYLLSLTPMASGKIPDQSLAICKGIGEWLDINGEAIYATRRWKIPAEGPITSWYLDREREGIMWDYTRPNQEGEFRFTRSKDDEVLYAIMMTWPENGRALIKSLKQGSKYYPGQIDSVSLLGSEAKLEWERTPEGLEIELPQAKPCQYAFSFKIQ